MWVPIAGFAVLAAGWTLAGFFTMALTLNGLEPLARPGFLLGHSSKVLFTALHPMRSTVPEWLRYPVHLGLVGRTGLRIGVVACC